GTARCGGRGSARSRSVKARPQLHRARRKHCVSGQRRRIGHGDNGHHQILRRRTGKLPRRRRRRDGRTGDGSFQDSDRGQESKSDPREHFRGYHEMRRDRARHYQRSENTEGVRAAGRSPRRNKRRAREPVVKRKWPGADCRGRSRRRRAESRCCREAQMKLGPTSVLLAIAATLCAEELPRKAKTTRENYPNVDVIYDSVTAPDGKRLRTIITKPRDAKGKVPVIFVAGWLSCDSVEAPADTKDAAGIVFRGLAQLPEFAL